MKGKLLALVLFLQSAWLVTTIYQHEQALRRSTHVLLETAPVDPRDWIRGDFLRLQYPIGSIPKDRFRPPLDQYPRRGTTVYVVLSPSNQVHQLDYAQLTRPADVTGPVLEGKVSDTTSVPDPDIVRVDYGLERYYVPEGTGNPQGRLLADVAIPASGHGSLRQLLLDGQPYEQAMRARVPGRTNAP